MKAEVYSAFTPAVLATLPQRSKSLRSTAANASAPSPTGTRLTALIFSAPSADLMMRESSSSSFLTMSFGVAAGTKMPIQPSASKPA